MPKVLSGAVVLVVLLGAADARDAGSAAKAAPAPACVEAKPDGPGDVVRALYAAYPLEGTKVVENEPREVISKYFDETMTGLLLKDRECVKRVGGLCNITAALLYAAQDADIVDFRVCVSRRGGEWIDVRFTNFGEHELITFRMTKTSAGWRISDLLYGGERSVAKALATPL